MVTETGTATSYNDLLTKFKDFLVTDAGWTQLAIYGGRSGYGYGNAIDPLPWRFVGA